MIVLLGLSTACAQGFWFSDGRNHPELRWSTIETAHFSIHYHQGLEALARRAATIAESVYGPVTRQLDTRPGRRTSIVLTRQDEIANGYALNSGQIFIWVDVNDAVTSFSGTEKWLRKVIAHEFQHVVAMESMRSWLFPWDLYFVPSWFLEGAAEYFTESWGIYRSDRDVRAMTLRNRIGDLDPHDSGFAMVLYLAREYGDSTIVKLVKHRTSFGTYSFAEAFRKATGRTVTAFERDWRRTMQGHYFGALAAKEGVKDAGEFLRVPLPRVYGMAWSPDSTRFAVVGAAGRDMQDRGLYIMAADSTRRFREVDHGAIDARPAWSPDGRSLAYARYRRGSHGSLVWDLYRLDLEGDGARVKGRGRWLTRDARANDPAWSPDGREIVYLAQRDETANLHVMDASGGAARPLTTFTGDVQILSPSFSPDGAWIAFTVFDEESGPDIAVIGRDGTGFRHVTRDTLYDTHPVWSADGTAIYFTSERDGIANLYRVGVAPGSAVESLTDVGEGIWSVDRVPGADLVVAMTLNTVDSARVVLVSGDRRAAVRPFEQNPDYTDWRRHAPGITLPKLTRAELASIDVPMSEPRDYRAWRDIRPLLWAVLPSRSGLGGIVVVNDALGRHTLAVGGGLDWDASDVAGQLSYFNATQAPLIDLSLYTRLRTGLRVYDRELLEEELTGGSAGLTFSLNRGDRLDANHSLRISADLVRRTPDDPAEFAGSPLPVPEGGRVGIAALEYRWLARRPSRSNTILPRQGRGAALRVAVADRDVVGDFSYRRGGAELFANRRLPFLGMAAFARGRFEAIGGRPPAQEVVGVTRDDGFHLPPGSLLEPVASRFIERYETARLRGWPRTWLGTRALWGTVELRMPFGAPLPVNVFGISPGRMTVNLFVDGASVWSGGDRAAKTWRATQGAELNHEVRLGGETVFVGSWGVAQPWHRWKQGSVEHAEGYFRAALVNPF